MFFFFSRMDLPRFRHGVCESCNAFGWTQKSKQNRYLCPQCFEKNDLPPVAPVKYILQSVSLTPKYIGSDMFSIKEISEMVQEILDTYLKTGKLPSRPDGNITVGYDYGLLLYNLNLLHNDSSRIIYEKMLSILDETGAWVERYDGNQAKGTRYRPWESSINIEAAINFAMKY